MVADDMTITNGCKTRTKRKQSAEGADCLEQTPVASFWSFFMETPCPEEDVCVSFSTHSDWGPKLKRGPNPCPRVNWESGVTGTAKQEQPSAKKGSAKPTHSALSRALSGALEKPPGLPNLGATTCYLNSTLQCLLRFPLFVEHISNPELKKQNDIENPPPLLGDLAKLVQMVTSPTTGACVVPVGVMRTIYDGLKTDRLLAALANGDQQDSGELTHKLLDWLHELNSNEDVGGIKGGCFVRVRSYWKCSWCSVKFFEEDQRWVWQRCAGRETAVSGPETQCPMCKQTTTIKLLEGYVDSPSNLFMTIQRPRQEDKYCLPFQASLTFPLLVGTQRPSITMELYGASCYFPEASTATVDAPDGGHVSSYSGHYTAYVRAEHSKSGWYLCDDAKVEAETAGGVETTVQRACAAVTVCWRQVDTPHDKYWNYWRRDLSPKERSLLEDGGTIKSLRQIYTSEVGGVHGILSQQAWLSTSEVQFFLRQCCEGGAIGWQPEMGERVPGVKVVVLDAPYILVSGRRREWLQTNNLMKMFRSQTIAKGDIPDLILAPLHVDGDHWILFAMSVVVVGEDLFLHTDLYDTLSCTVETAVQQASGLQKVVVDYFEGTEERRVHSSKPAYHKLASQRNSSDCGVCVIMLGWGLVCGVNPRTFHSSALKCARQRLTCLFGKAFLRKEE